MLSLNYCLIACGIAFSLVLVKKIRLIFVVKHMLMIYIKYFIKCRSSNLVYFHLIRPYLSKFCFASTNQYVLYVCYYLGTFWYRLREHLKASSGHSMTMVAPNSPALVRTVGVSLLLWIRPRFLYFYHIYSIFFNISFALSTNQHVWTLS